MNICNYTPVRDFDFRGVNDRFKLLFREVCYLRGNSGGGTIQTIVGGTDISIDSTDPANPIVNYTGASGGSPAGNEGNVQINTGGSFGTPASDSLSYNSGVLTVKDTIAAIDMLLGTTAGVPNAAAALHIESSTKGFLPPRMTALQANAIPTPPDGLIVYVNNTDGTFTSVGLWCLESGVWQKLSNEVVNVSSGGYTPIPGDLSNIDSIDFASSGEIQYMQVGEVVTVSGEVEIDTTAGGAYSFTIDLPIASANIQSYNAGGTGCPGLAGEFPCFKIKGYDITNDKVQFVGVSGSSDPVMFSFSFTYRIVN